MSSFVERMWRDEGSAGGTALRTVLLPAEALFRAGVAARNRVYDLGLQRIERAAVPVISIGNIAVGGAGKTPFAAFIARRLRVMGHSPALLHGGYSDDEPVLHRQWNPDVPVVVGRDRVKGARAAVEAGASVVILDDGFQHRRLARGLDLVLVAAETWTSEPRLLPRGAWREPPPSLRRASAVVVTCRTSLDPAPIHDAVSHIAPGVPVWTARMIPEQWRRPGTRKTDGPPSGPVLVVAAIAHPDLFVSGVRAAGAHVGDALTFRDHHAYTSSDASSIRRRAAGRPIVTTAKDWVKLRALLAPDDVWLLEQDVTMSDGAAGLEQMLASLRNS